MWRQLGEGTRVTDRKDRIWSAEESNQSPDAWLRLTSCWCA